MIPVIGYTTILSKQISSLNDKLGVDEPGWVMTRENYLDIIESVGGAPLPIKHSRNKKILDRLYNLCDGFIFPGGSDIDPRYYSEKKNKKILREIDGKIDELEFYLIKKALKDKKPILGICRGMQLINVACGGSLYQDIISQLEIKNHTAQKYPSYPDCPKTKINIEENSRLFGILEEKEITVNCAHHQAVKVIGEGLMASAYSPEKIIEALEKADSKHWVLGTQGHIEASLETSPKLIKIFESFIKASQEYSIKKDR